MKIYVIKLKWTGYLYTPKRYVSYSLKWVNSIDKARKYSKICYAERSLKEILRYHKEFNLSNFDIIEINAIEDFGKIIKSFTKPE